MTVLEVDKLTKYFSSGLFKKKLHKAVDGVSFSIEPGKTLGLIGESGSGKTTIARLILGLIRPTAGRVIFDGTDVPRAHAKHLKQLRKKIQIVFQNPETAFNPKMKLKQSLAEPLRVHGLASRKNEKDKVFEMAQRLDLNVELLDRYPHELSGGQIQRAVLARLLSLDPKLIVLDEPTSMLDVSHQANILALLKEIQSAVDIAYLFISHDLEVVGHMCDTIGVLHKGELVEHGSVGQVFTAPRHAYTRYLISSYHEFSRLTGIGGRIDASQEYGGSPQVRGHVGRIDHRRTGNRFVRAKAKSG
jgi:ABC-type oligopeptide transport system ATPase subunit